MALAHLEKNAASTWTKNVEAPNIMGMLFGGGVNASMLGATNHGSTEANIAQRHEVYNQLDNLMKGGGDKVTYTSIQGEDGEPLKLPYVDGDSGELVYPNDKGVVRAINGGYLERWKEINDQIEDKIDDIMEYCIISDQLASWVLGIEKDAWDAITAKKGTIEGMSAELADENCSIAYIKSLPSGSISQTRSLSKLRYVVSKNLRNVNIKGLVSKDKMKQDMKTGKMENDPKTLASIDAALGKI